MSHSCPPVSTNPHTFDWRWGLLGLGLLASVAGAGVAVADEERGASIALILDASGSMNDPLVGDERRIDAAKGAVIKLVKSMSPGARMSFHAYGHQYNRDLKNCRDTEKLVSFGAVNDVRDDIIAAVSNLQAQGFTPITRAIIEAAKDIATEDSENRIVILVSDGQETCKGDPCEATRALANADAKLTVHTIGFGVDSVAKSQLQCIASVAHGQYFDARDANELERVLKKVAVVRKVITFEKKTGQILLRNADLSDKTFGVVNVKTGKNPDGAFLAGTDASVVVPEGTYNITDTYGTIADEVVVKAGQKVIIDPAILEFHNSDGGASVMAAAAGTVIGTMSIPGADRISYLLVKPGTYDLQSGIAVWKSLKLSAGKRTVVNAAYVTIKGPADARYDVMAEGGEIIAQITPDKGAALPGGSYTLSNGEAQTAFELTDGQRLELEVGN